MPDTRAEGITGVFTCYWDVEKQLGITLRGLAYPHSYASWKRHLHNANLGIKSRRFDKVGFFPKSSKLKASQMSPKAKRIHYSYATE